MRRLTDKSSLELLEREAKRWLSAIRAGDAEARTRLLRSQPKPAEPIGLRDVQHALAREHGFANWRALKEAALDVVLGALPFEERVEQFLDLACLSYGVRPGSNQWDGHTDSPARQKRAARLLEKDPALAQHSIHTAVVCGDVDEVRRRLQADATLANAKGGLRQWSPLLYLAYGRLPSPDASNHAVEIATLLLDHGADPSAAWHYQWETTTMDWPVLCGVIGDGEAGPVALPPHPKADELALLLLSRGANPNPSQALYNTMLRKDDPHWLDVLIRHGLTAQHPVTWDPKEGPEHTMFQYLLGHAVERGHVRRAKVLLENGAQPDKSPRGNLYRLAMRGGNLELAELLARHGAQKVPLTGFEQFECACLSGEEDTAKQLFQAHPEYRERAEDLLVNRVCGARDLVEPLRVLLDLGVSPDATDAKGRYRALHIAACSDAIGVLDLLLERGADVDALDRDFNARPIGWALHTRSSRTLEALSRHTRCVFSLVAGGQTEALRQLLQSEPAVARDVIAGQRLGLGHQGAAPGETPLFVLPEDEDAACDIIALLLAHGSDPYVVNGEGKTALDRARERGLLEAVDALESAMERTSKRLQWFEAADKGDVGAARALLEQDPDLVAARRERHEEGKGGIRWGTTALHVAAQHGHTEFAAVLLDAGADIEARASGNDRDGGGTPLHWAAHYRHLPMVQLLIARGANPNPEPDLGSGTHEGGAGHAYDLFEDEAVGRFLSEHGTELTLFGAIGLRDLARVEALLLRDPTLVHSTGDLEFTPLHVCAASDCPEAIALLVARGANLDARDRVGRTAIDVALLLGHEASFRKLHAAGARPSAEALNKASTIERAVELARFFDACASDVALAEKLLEGDATLARSKLPSFWKNNYVGATALHFAAATGNDALITLLLRFAPDLTLQDEQYGGTAAGWAKEYGHHALAEQLAAVEKAVGDDE